MDRSWDNQQAKRLNRGEVDALYSTVAGPGPLERIRDQLDEPEAWEIDCERGVYELRRRAEDG